MAVVNCWKSRPVMAVFTSAGCERASLAEFLFDLPSPLLVHCTRYDTVRVSAIRSGKGPQASYPDRGYFRHRPRVSDSGLELPLLRRRTTGGQVLRRAAEAGLRDGLRHLVSRPRLETASAKISRLPVQQFHAGLGTRRAVGAHQELPRGWLSRAERWYGNQV